MWVQNSKLKVKQQTLEKFMLQAHLLAKQPYIFLYDIASKDKLSCMNTVQSRPKQHYLRFIKSKYLLINAIMYLCFSGPWY